ncbi:MAG: class I adenylate-forming enzyme family protein [Rhodospirillaceae bacterium]|nr:class I adenylate-forming enzyme family protein [Rhodospirillaceae bacterium]
MTMAGALRAAAARDPGKLAIRAGGQTRTYAQLIDRIDRITNATIRDLGLAPGHNAAIVAWNCLEYLEIACGVPEAGLAVATINARLTPADILAVCDDAEARVLFVDAAAARALRGLPFKTVRRIIEIGPEFEAWIDAHGDAVARPAIAEWDTWTIPYTSGTTGAPKGVMLSHRARLLNYYAKAVEYACFGPDDRFLSITPMNHGPGLGFPMNALVFGGFTEVMDKFDPLEVLRKLKHEGFTGIFTVPTHFHAMFDLDPVLIAPYRDPPVKAIISNAAPLPQATKEKIVAFFGPGVLHELFSSTENSLVSNMRPADQLRKVQCVGLPFSQVLVKILDDAGRDCAPGEVGELFSKSPYLFSGYWNRPAETAAAFRDGWVTVGDLARRDDEGFIYIVGRKKDMVISGGVNIYPQEIENVLSFHPAVAEVAVIGVPDTKWGERLKAFVVTRPGHPPPTADALAAFAANRLAAFKIPKDVTIIDALPRNANGKVLKTELRKLL